VVCLEPGCMKHFTNVQCLQAHVKSTHQYMTCETCGTKQLKKNIKRHLRTHEPISSPETFRCDFKGCSCTFSRVRLLILKHISCKFQLNSQCGYMLNFLLKFSWLCLNRNLILISIRRLFTSRKNLLCVGMLIVA